MMEMPGLAGMHHHHHIHRTGSPDAKTTASATCHVVKGAASRMDYVEMHDIHHPNCTAAAAQQQLGAGGELRDIEAVDTLLLSSEAYRATEAIEFIAEHLKSDDEYIQVIEFYF